MRRWPFPEELSEPSEPKAGRARTVPQTNCNRTEMTKNSLSQLPGCMSRSVKVESSYCKYRCIGVEEDQQCANWVHCKRRGSEKTTFLVIFWGVLDLLRTTCSRGVPLENLYHPPGENITKRTCPEYFNVILGGDHGKNYVITKKLIPPKLFCVICGRWDNRLFPIELPEIYVIFEKIILREIFCVADYAELSQWPRK